MTILAFAFPGEGAADKPVTFADSSKILKTVCVFAFGTLYKSIAF